MILCIFLNVFQTLIKCLFRFNNIIIGIATIYSLCGDCASTVLGISMHHFI